MSIVSVHGPTMYSPGTGNVTSAQVSAVGDTANGLKFTFTAVNTQRAAADYDWTFPGGTPATATDNKGPITVTYATAGDKIATLTVAAGAGPPAGGAYPVTVTATSGPRSGEEQPADDGESYAQSAPEGDVQVEVGYDPAAHTVTEVIGYAEDHPEDLEALLIAEEEGKNRSTLISHLEGMR